MTSPKHEVTPKYAYITDAEALASYSPGGLHPIAIGDQLKHRYSIVHKLGFGTFSTTWLARDVQLGSYVALKIARADSDSNEFDTLHILKNAQTSLAVQRSQKLIVPLLDSFTIDGPNGKHLCYVMEPAACSLSDSKGSDGGLFRLEAARAMAAQVAYAVEFVHSCGLVHGDLHLGNILLRLSHDLNDLSIEDIYRKYGAPELDAVSRVDGKPIGLGVPTHIPQIPWMGVPCADITLTDARVFLADFGTSFSPSAEKSTAAFCAPTSVCPPEAWFESAPPVFSSDIWTLGCSLWSLLAWRSPFESFPGDKDDIISRQIDALGPLPAAWWNKWEARGEYFTDQGEPVGGRNALSLDERFDDLVQQLRAKTRMPVVSMEEKMAFLSMIRSMLSYRPEDRPTIQEVLNSEWMQRWAIPEYQKLKSEHNSPSAV